MNFGICEVSIFYHVCITISNFMNILSWVSFSRNKDGQTIYFLHGGVAISTQINNITLCYKYVCRSIFVCFPSRVIAHAAAQSHCCHAGIEKRAMCGEIMATIPAYRPHICVYQC